MKIIIISPYSRQLRNDGVNPKNYPYWDKLVELLILDNYYVVQIGVDGEKKIFGDSRSIKYEFKRSLLELTNLVKNSHTWISVDNFFPHLCHLIPKPGFVIFGPSDPNIFGHKENTNILKDRKYLREKQFDIWEVCPSNNDSFLPPEDIIRIIKKH